jgi:hypothetical protein
MRITNRYGDDFSPIWGRFISTFSPLYDKIDTMIASLLFLLLGVVFGFTLLRATKSPLHIEEQFIFGVPVGTMVLALLTFFLALALPNQDWAIMGGAIAAGIFVLFYFNMSRNRAAIKKEITDLKHRLKKQELIAWAVVLVPWLIYTIVTVPMLLTWRDGNLVAGWINVWGDWAVHLRTSTFFAEHTKLTLESPLYSGVTFHYPYLSAYLSAILQRLGLDIAASLTWPTIILFGALPGCLYILAKRLTNNTLASIFFVYFFLLNGGMGVYYLIKDLMAGHYFWQHDAYNALLYTDAFRENGLSTNNSIWFMNVIMSELFPQRAFLSGIGIALYVLLIGWTAIKEKLPRVPLVVAGVLFGVLPMMHTHSFIALVVSLPILWLCVNASKLDNQITRKLIDYSWLLVPAALVGAFTLFTFVFDLHRSGSFMHAIHWWVPQSDQPVNPLVYWFRNAGPLIVLGIIAIFKKKQPLWPLIVAGLVIFIVCNMVSFQPWPYDNLKILTYWDLLWLLPISVLVAELKGRLVPLLIVAVIALTGAGLADALSVTVSEVSGGIQLAASADITYAQAVRRYTANQEKTLILAATSHDNPLSLAAGRQLYMGYEGWLWTYGQDWASRFDEMQEMYSASDRGLELIKEKKINYIELGLQERDRFKPNEAKLRELFPAVLQGENYTLLKVR